MKDHSAASGRNEPSFDELRQEWLTSAEAARALGLTPSTLRDYRSKGRGPRFYKRGHFVLYRRLDIEAHLRGEASDD